MREVETFLYSFGSAQLPTFNEYEVIAVVGLPHSPHQYQPVICYETAMKQIYQVCTPSWTQVRRHWGSRNWGCCN